MTNESVTQQTTTGGAMIRRLEEGASYWQPVPANGFVRCLLNSDEVGAEHPFSLGTQTVAPGGCFVRTHAHDRHDEVIYFLEGTGRIELDDAKVVERAEPGTVVYVGRNRRHSFVNDSDAPLTFLWLLMPAGLETFFERIGRPRAAGEEPPAPFPRPENVEQIEAETVFAVPTQTSEEN
ncbi:cupin domain-containing protein [Celeribacter sp.]|uniref:cupin domain-containing protein n=1 Tax=Celeribacter sp. TaxID=1890673 RepID=UPI003A90BE64